MNIINITALENLIRKNWTTFIDKNRLIAFVLQCARDSKPTIIQGKTKDAFQISVSRFEFDPPNLVFWIEFSIPKDDNSVITGTTELVISRTGDFIKDITITQWVLPN